MVRNTAREIAIHLSYELSFTDKSVEELLSDRLSAETFASLAGEDTIYQEAPNAKQAEYIRRLVCGVEEHEGGVYRFDVYFNATKANIDRSSILKKLKSQCRKE